MPKRKPRKRAQDGQQSRFEDLRPLFESALEEVLSDTARLALNLSWRTLLELEELNDEGERPTPRQRREIHQAARGWMTSALKASAQAGEREIAELMRRMDELQSGEGSVETIQ